MAKVSLRAYNREIETMIDRGQLDEAIAHCHHILKIYPKNLETYRLLGKAYLEYKRYGDAADIFSRVLVSVPNDFVAQVGMSIIRDEENKLDDAIWHMERAFETQPSNPAIQSELQRLYGRRDGVQPPRIRMTRGALAHMYVQGELYPQAISEIKSVLNEDAGRSDLQALLARACYKSGLKNEAVDVASSLLRRYPYALDANRVLVEILGAERPENAQLYRQRVIELDPYAAQVMGSVFQSNEVPEAAVSIERLDWNGQPVPMQPDWSESKAISLEPGVVRDDQPDWLKGSFNEMSAATAEQPTLVPAQPAEDIPDFMRAAGWGQSTGTFDESKSAFTEGASTGEQPIAQGDLPDWVKAMKPTESEPVASPQEEELPDWINNIGAGALSSVASEQTDWMSQLEQPSSTQAGDQPDWLSQLDQTPSTPAGAESLDWINQLGEAPSAPAAEESSDWMKQLGETPATPAAEESLDWINQLGETPATPAAEESLDWMNQLGQTPSTPAAEDQPDWLKSLGAETESASAAATSEEPDWLKGFGTEPDLQPQSGQEDAADWLKGLGSEPEPASSEQADQPDWLQQFAAEAETPASESASTDFDFLHQLTEEPVLPAPESTPPAINLDNLGTSEKERDDSFAWLESLAAKQGASEGLLTTPEERLEEEPEWVKQAKGLNTTPPSELIESTVSEPSENVNEPVASLGELGKSEQEQDDSFAWLENLAARQGATEGLLTKPEERLEEEPEWVKQAKSLGSEQAAPTPPVANLEELGKTEQEQDDSFAWLENLAAKQGATEGLLTKPEERLEHEPEWVRLAKDLGTPQPPVASTPEAELPSELEPEPAQPIAMDETASWLQSLEEEEQKSTPVADETAMWLKSLDAEESTPVQEMQSTEGALPDWMQDIVKEETPVTESSLPAEELKPESEWQSPVDEPVAIEEPKLEESIPSWLADLEKEEERSVSATADEDLPAWLRAEETATSTPERTQPSDWKPVEETESEIIYSPPLEETKEAETEMPLPVIEETEPEEIAEQVQPQIIYSPPLAEEPAEPQYAEAAAELQEPSMAQPVMQATPEPSPQPVARKTPTVAAGTDQVLGIARNELSRSNVSGALESYGKLIKKGRFLDEVIYDLREALYRYPVEVNLWQSLGDAYMRANRLQDALDAYTKAEELLR